MELLLTQPDCRSGQELYQQLFANIRRVIKGQDAVIRKVLAAFLGGGHVLLEDSPGTGKTTLAKALAQSVAINFKRIQFTPDLLPADILGVSVFNPASQTFTFHPGPIFAHLVLADEINRASPRTQSALLEAMAESQVTIEGQQRPLPDPFFVIATQNPSDAEGTYPLPEAQMDRFALQLQLGHVSPAAELEILASQSNPSQNPLAQSGALNQPLQPILGLAELAALKQAVRQIRISHELKHYIVEIVAATRHSEAVRLGASPRGSIALMQVAQALALFDGDGFVTPDHIQEVAADVLAHRLVLSTVGALANPRDCIEEILTQIPVPI
jgi:MoxR-like ATPase